MTAFTEQKWPLKSSAQGYWQASFPWAERAWGVTAPVIVYVATPAPASPTPSVSSSVFVSTALARPLVDSGSDVLVFPGLDETFTLVSDGRVLAEALARRLTTPRGTLPFHADYGLDLRSYLGETITQDVLYRLKAAVERECELDERVLTASATVTYSYQTQALRVRVSVTTSNGPFKFVLNVTSLTVEMLGEE